MASTPKKTDAAPETPAPIIIKKIIGGHGGAHGGAWKIALADMMTAMMAFFLLMWLLGATNTDARKSIADYFKQTPLLKMGSNAGSNGVLGGRSMISPEGLPDSVAQTSIANVMSPTQASGGEDRDEGPEGQLSANGEFQQGEGRSGQGQGAGDGGPTDDKKFGSQSKTDTVQEGAANTGQGDSADQTAKDAAAKPADEAPKDGGLSDAEKKKIAADVDKNNLEALEAKVMEAIKQDPNLTKLAEQVQFVRVKEGVRIEIIDKADFSMFAVGTTRVLPRASGLVGEVAKAISELPNKVVIRGHTDSRGYALDNEMNNWLLSAERAESTRQVLELQGVAPEKIVRVEGVADTEPFNKEDPMDVRNRRISITLQFQDGQNAETMPKVTP
jgi:chemotaxis protein MotB